MTNAELAKEIKALPGMLSLYREEVEDRIQNFVPFPSGLISYAWGPVEEAIGQYQEYIEGWRIALLYPREYHTTPTEVKLKIASAEDMIARLKE